MAKLNKGTYIICDPAIVYPTKIDWDELDNPLMPDFEETYLSNPYGRDVWTCRTFGDRVILGNAENTVIESKTGLLSVIPVEQLVVEGIYDTEEISQLRDTYVFTSEEDFFVDYLQGEHIKVDTLVIRPEPIDSDWDDVNFD